MNPTRFRRMAAMGATVGIAAGAIEIIRHRQRRRSAEAMTRIEEEPKTPRWVPATNTMANEVDRGKPTDLSAAESEAHHFELPGSLLSHSEASALLTTSQRELSNASKLDSVQARKMLEPSFIGHWITILLIVAMASGFTAYHFWRQGFSSKDNPPQAAGGLLMFTAEPLGSRMYGTVAVNSYQTGFPGVSVLDLTLNFRNARPGTRWFIAASGQYAPRIDTPLAAFCPDTSAARLGAIVACRNNGTDGSRNVTYNFEDHIGALDGRQIMRITDSLDGYIDTDAVILSGILARSPQDQSSSTLTTRIIIPIQSPDSSQVGSDEYFAYAPIAIVDQGDFGTGAPLGKITTAHPQAFFADSFSRTPVNYLSISSLSLSVDVGTRENQLTWASPPTVRAGQLRWRTKGQGIGTVKFTLHDPFAADRLSRDSFFAGIFVSITASALLLLLERLIEWWARRRTLQALNNHPAQSGNIGDQAGQPDRNP
jgi:hypothetical protein